MGEGIQVDALDRFDRRCRARHGLGNRWLAQMWGNAGCGGELGAELAEAQVMAALGDEPEGGRIPECRCAAVAEQDLVPIGQAEQFGQTVAQLTDQELHG